MIITRKKNYKKVIINLIVSLVVISGASLASYQFLFNNNSKTPDQNNTATESDKKTDEVKSNDTVVTVKKYIDISAADTYKLIAENADTVIIDVSGEYSKGHLPKAVNHKLTDTFFSNNIQTIDKTKTYLVYCHADEPSTQGAQKLIDSGVEKVYRLQGNYPAWSDGGYPVEINFYGIGTFLGGVVANRSYLDGKYTLNLEVSGSAPDAGKFFEGWLLNNETTLSTGKLVQEGDKYKLAYTSTEDLRNLPTVIITEETESYGLDGISELHIFEGSF